MPHNPRISETKIQKMWNDKNVAKTTMDFSKKKYYCLEMFMYPSGKIHMGHVRNYTIGDAIARYHRMLGEAVLHPMGFDAFGLPAENAAIKGQAHPKIWTDTNIEYMKVQLDRLGFLYDWDREIRTCEPDYYKWNQWFFLKMLEKGLVYRANSPVNWCPDCETVLANEQVSDGKCWRCGSQVFMKNMEQWFIRTTAYAEELYGNLEQLKEWPQEVILMQKNWIGKSEGAMIDFGIDGSEKKVTIFTTRIDTIYGATYLVLAPEHPLVDEITQKEKREEISQFKERMAKQGTQERVISKEKLGAFTGSYAINPFSKEKIPIYVANFVLMDYGTGAIMSVPAHDQRDFEFAQKYKLPIRVVVSPPEGLKEPLSQAYEEDGILVNSGEFNGLQNRFAMQKMAEKAERENFGKKTTTYRLKDWGVSRQRYWGTPIPVVYCKECGTVPVPYEDLPVLLPYDVPFTGKGESPLVKVESFVKTKCPKCGKEAKRETDTMDTFFDSSWYFFRYPDPKISDSPINKDAVKYFNPIDFYIGGIEHATMHLIYCRFFTMFMRDIGLIDFGEPVKRLMCQGMVIKDGKKMSKSIGNIVDPDKMIDKYGADAVRLNILFLAPPTDQLDWKEEGAEGSRRYLQRVYSLIEDNKEELLKEVRSPKSGTRAFNLRKITHQTIKKVTEEFSSRLKINTIIASLMELTNHQYKFLEKYDKSPEERFALKESIEAKLKMLSPIAPHICDELWLMLGNNDFLINEKWPSYDPDIAKEEEIEIPVQVNGKLKGVVKVKVDDSEEIILDAAKNEPKVRAAIEGKSIVKQIVVKGKIVTFVVK
ncbi:MAG: leucine--tRNA ligase [Acidobacteriota bacterium]